MRLVGTSDSGWVAVDLREIAGAIAALRDSATVQRLRAQREQQEPKRDRDLRAAG